MRKGDKHFKKGSIMVFLFGLSLCVTALPVVCFGASLEFNRGLDTLVGRIVTEMQNRGKVCLAVVDFTDLNGGVSELGIFISEELLTRIQDSQKLKIVERRLLDKVLDEHNMGLGGLLDPASVQRLGKIIGVEAVCTGTIADLRTTFKVNARIIGVESGEVFSAESVEINKNDALRILMRRYRMVKKAADTREQKQAGGQGYNLIVNGDFSEEYTGWSRRIGDMRQGVSRCEIIKFPSSRSGKALHIQHQGKGYIQFSQMVSVPTSDLVFSVTFQAATHEGPLKAFSGTGVVQIGLQYFDPKGYKLGQTVLLNYVKNPFADTPLIGVPRRRRDTYKCHYEELGQGRVYYNYQIDIRREIEDNLLGVDPELIEEIGVILWCGATHPQAGAELWVADVSLRMK